MSASRILRLPRRGKDTTGCVLVKVESSGSSKLDLRLIGTNGSLVFVGNTKHDSISKLQARSYRGGSEDLVTSLSEVLLSDGGERQAKDIEAVADVDDKLDNDNKLNIVIQNNIQGITQRVAAITLNQDDFAEIDIFDWAVQAAASYDVARDTIRELRMSIEKQQRDLETLNAQLDDLVKAKTEHESQLMHKFAELLNAKKLKIRDQQRLLSHATIDPVFAGQMSNSRVGRERRQVGTSRTTKRKTTVSDNGDDESGDGFDDVPANAGPIEDEMEDLHEQATPEGSDRDETEDEVDEQGGDDPSRARRDAQDAGERNASASQKHISGPEPGLSKPLELPPRRELPFAQKSSGRKTPSSQNKGVSNAVAQIGAEDEETDDEL